MVALISAEEVAHRVAFDAELIAWADERGRSLDSLPHVELRKYGLIDRGTFTLLFNSAGELYVQHWALSRAVYPGYWDLTASGMVQAGEPYVDSVARKPEEELGIHDAVLRECDHFFFDEPGNRFWCAVLSVVSNAPLRLQTEEIFEARLIHPGLVLEGARSLPYCPDSLQALCLYLDA